MFQYYLHKIATVLTLSILLLPVMLTAQVRYVTVTGAGTFTGNSWANAAPGNKLQDMINASNAGEQVWVAKGNYKPNSFGSGWFGHTPRDYAFSFVNGVFVYGGFSGNEILITQRNIKTNPTYLDGDIGIAGDNSDNCYHVVLSYSSSNYTFSLDGFTLQNGNADGNNGISGGGMWIQGSIGANIKNCTFLNNNVTRSGGGVSLYSVSNILFENCIFQNNHATDGGGLIIENCYLSPSIINCIFINNTAQDRAGAILELSSQPPSLFNCTIIHNSAYSGGSIATGDDIKITNSILWGNTSLVGLPDIDGHANITYSLTNGSYAGIGNINSSPFFINETDPDGPDNVWATSDDGLMIACNSPAKNSGINNGAPATDILGTARPQSGTVDIGAYENADPPIVPTVTITASATSICRGTPVTFTAANTNGGTAPIYQWKINNIAMGGGVQFSPPILNNGDIVSCDMTSNADCVSPATVSSNTVLIIVTDQVAPTITISTPPEPVCAGTDATFTAVITNGGDAPFYQWKVNGNNAGTNSPVFILNTPFTYNAVSCELTSNATCTMFPKVLSNSVWPNIIPSVTPTISIATPISNICAGTPVTFNTNTMYGGATPTFQWKVNGNNAGTNAPVFTSGTLANNDIVSCELTSTERCPVPATVLSNGIAISVGTQVTPTISITTPSASICSGSAATFNATITNGGGIPFFQWKVNGNYVGSNSPVFSSTTLADNDIVSCELRSNEMCVTSPNAISNSIIVSVTTTAIPAINITTPLATICSGSEATFNAIVTNSGSTPTYHWMVSGIPAGTNAPVFTTKTLVSSDIVSCELISNAACTLYSNAWSNDLSINVNAPVTPTINITTQSVTICSGTAATFNTVIKNGGSTPIYQWKINGNNEGTNAPIFTSNTLANNDIVSCELTSSEACATSTTVLSNSITVSVGQQLTPTISITTPSTVICSGSAATFNAVISNGGTNPFYQWKINGINTGANTATFTSSAIADDDIISCLLTSNETCVTSANAVSNNITTSVSTSLTPVISITTPSKSICEGSAATFNATIANGGTIPFYQWKVNGINTGTNAPVFISNTLANNDIISCLLTGNEACTTSANAISNNITALVNAPVVPSVTIVSSSIAVCEGAEVICNAAAVNGGSAPAWQWKLNNNNVGLNSSIYTTTNLRNGDILHCVLTSSEACIAQPAAVSNTLSFTVNSNPSVNAGNDKIILSGGSAKLDASVNGNIASMIWQPATGLDNSIAQNPLASPQYSTTYKLRVTTAEGCEGADEVIVKVVPKINIPNAFSPNGDGINDLWYIRDLENFPACTVEIFNRNGQNLFYSKGYGNAWNGKYKNQNLPLGTYYYIIDLKNATPVLSGSITILY